MLANNETETTEPSEQSGGSSFLSPKVRNGVYVAYGIFVLLMSGFQLLRETYSVPALEKQEALLAYIYRMSCTYLYAPAIGLFVAYGLITHRKWARYGVIAAMLTLPVTLPLALMVYGSYLSPVEISVQILLAILIIVFFVRFPLHQDTGTTFRANSFAGLLVLVILALSVRPLSTPLYWKYKSGEPLFISKAKTIVIDADKYKAEYTNQRKIETPKVSFYIPYGYHVVSFEGDDKAWRISLLNNSGNEKGFVLLGNSNQDQDLLDTQDKERLGITNGLDFERFMYTNNWSPGAVFFRAMFMHGKYEFNEFDLGELRGFLRITQTADQFFYEFGLYGKDGRLMLAGTVSSDSDKNDSGERIAESIIASVEVSPPIRNAADYYKSGLDLYNKGNPVDAQFAFAQAYFQKPKNPEYAYMLVKSLMTEKHHFYKSMERILEGSLKANPGNEKLEKLLDELKAKDKDEG